MAKTRKRAVVARVDDDGFPGGEPEPSPSPPPVYEKYLKAVGEIDGWKQASEVLDEITSVRTVFPDFNRAARVGGLPVRRIHTIHGETHGGKTAFVLGLVKSFVDAGFLAAYVDAEHALGSKFAGEMVVGNVAREMAADLSRRPNFLARRPKSYEEIITGVDVFLHKVAEARRVHPEIKSIVVIDTINKLVPKRELARILQQDEDTSKKRGRRGKSSGADELAKGHQGRYRAALNQAWLDHLTPLVADSDCAMVMIAQEREDETDDVFAPPKVKGGACLLFDASMVARVMKASPVFVDPSKPKSNDNICGFAHRVRLWKSKVGHMDGRYSDAIFHMSNGKFTPEGLDTARDAFVVGRELGIVSASGSWFGYRGKRVQGENRMVQGLHRTPGRLIQLLDDIAVKLDEIEGR